MSYPETLWVHDLDRNLLNTNLAFEHLVTTCVQEGVIRQDELTDARRQTEASGGSFDLSGYLTDNGLDTPALHGLYTVFSQTAQRLELLYPDAQRYLARLQKSGAMQLIMTYGEVAWQRAKIQASGLSDLPCVVTASKYKGGQITTWQYNDGYRVTCDSGETLSAEQVVLTDDKAVSFTDFPADARGYLVARDSIRLASQVGDVPANVARVSTMDEIVI